jgi:hypothetical protein
MNGAVRDRIADLVRQCDQADALLGGEGAGRLPGLLVARRAVAVDGAASKIAKLADQLAAASAKSPPKEPELLKPPKVK